MNNAPNIPEWVMSSAVRRRAFAEGLAEGRKIERAAIADWLREQDGHGYDDMRANLIEAGERRIVVECTVPEVAGALHIYNPD